MKLPELRIGNIIPRFPIIQGGMSVSVSTASLAGAVAKAGGIGVIGATGITTGKLTEEIKEARSLSGGGDHWCEYYVCCPGICRIGANIYPGRH